MKSFFSKKRGSSGSDESSSMLSQSISEASPNEVILSKGSAQFSPPPFERFYKYALTALIGYAIADLTILYFRDKSIPDSAPPAARMAQKPFGQDGGRDLSVITQRNIFNSDGIIPDPINQSELQEEDNSVPVPSTLPLVLVGTIVHANPGKSVATIEIKSAGNKIIPYIPNDEIESFATLVKVERRKAIFRNSQNGKLEYIEIKVEGLKFGLLTKAAPAVKAGDIKRDGNEFSLLRSDVNKYISNLGDIVQQARAVPNIVPGSGGEVQGFRLVDIAPDSIYEKLGLKPGDVIRSVNGEEVNSPAKAIELYNKLKTDLNIALDIERNGKQETFNYNIVD